MLMLFLRLFGVWCQTLISIHLFNGSIWLCYLEYHYFFFFLSFVHILRCRFLQDPFLFVFLCMSVLSACCRWIHQAHTSLGKLQRWERMCLMRKLFLRRGELVLLVANFCKNTLLASQLVCISNTHRSFLFIGSLGSALLFPSYPVNFHLNTHEPNPNPTMRKLSKNLTVGLKMAA